uniref:Uncharacterized protein n=1 Tax=Arundo donax TaxID=35708 RepID=A0A0A9C0G4_ARUDO
MFRSTSDEFILTVSSLGCKTT